MTKSKDLFILDSLLGHIAEQRVRAKLVDRPFDLGILTDKQPSQALEIIESNIDTLRKIGMINFHWHDDALRSTLNIADEELFVSVCRPR